MNRFGTSARFGLVTLLLLAGITAVWFSPSLLGAQMDKDPAPLTHDLILLPKELGGNPMFKAFNYDRRMAADEVDALGTKLYLLRDYTRVTAAGTPTEDQVELNINYYEKGTATPHVPDICWLGNGMRLVYDNQIVVHDVPHKDGTKGDIPMHLLSFQPQKDQGEVMPGLEEHTDNDRLVTVAYTFQVNGTYVGNRAQVAKLFWRRDSKYCYHCKIEIKYNGLCSPDKARPVIEAFLRASLPQIEECLPDWQKLNSPAGVTAAQRTVSGPSAVSEIR